MPKLPKRPAIKNYEKGIAYIPLGRYISHGFATVSIEDADMLQEYWWHKDSNGYAITGTGIKRGGANIYMHWLICPVKKGMQTDHINHIVLDNRRENLREVTPNQNMMNRRVHKTTRWDKPRTSQYKGVSLVSKMKGKPWQYAVYSKKIKGGRVYGYVATEVEAALAYNKAAIQHHGELAVLNEVTE